MARPVSESGQRGRTDGGVGKEAQPLITEATQEVTEKAGLTPG